MRLSKRTEYALRAAIRLAELPPGQFVQSRDLAKYEELPGKFLESILLGLRRGGFLESKVGSGGGYRLSRSPEQIRVGEIVQTLEHEAEAPSTIPATLGGRASRIVDEQLRQAAESVFSQLTLQELLEQASRADRQPQMYYI
ncbi:MAG: RrF2 family transcriptional regulator [Phycisphaerae bacterium]